MKKIFILVTAVAILSTVFLLIKGVGNRDGQLIGSRSQKTAASPTPNPSPISSPNVPKTFKFDASTDLKMELEKVNPQVLDSDFE